MHLASGLVCISSTLGISIIKRKDDYMKKFNLVLALALVLSLALVGCNKAPTTMDETDQSKMQDVASETDTAGNDALNAVTLSAEDAVKIFTDKYADAKIDNISFEMEKGSYVYEINGFDDASEYEMEINAADGSIINDKSEKDRDQDNKAIDLALLGNANELIESAKADAGEGFYLDSYSIDVDDSGNITKIEIEVKNANGKDIEYEYNLETKELIKKDK